MVKVFSFFFLLFLLLYPFSQAAAHGLGQSFRKEVDKYVLEFEYDALEVVDGDPVPYVFRIFEKESSKPTPISFVFARFVKTDTGDTVYIGRHVQDKIEEGTGRMTLALPQGEYKVELSFQSPEGTIAEAEFGHTVLVKKGSFPTKEVGIGVGGIILGGLLASLMAKGGKAKKE